jgi:thiamine pyrophosphate-dependent acetolactate synthase large subunit-like protein
MHLDKIDGAPDETVAWGSDIAAQMLRRLGIPYVSLNPGASYRGLHDSLVNHLGNERPGMLLCLHEDHAVAIAHGYAKAAGEPMACVLHSNVGLLHGMMGLYNAWCDRVPMIVLGATGPLDSEKRRPWIDWIHTTRDQGALVRSFVKWDDLPSSPQALVEAMCRANMLTRAAPSAPVYVCLDAGLQETKLEQAPEWPDLARFAPPAPVRPAREAVAQTAALLRAAERPLLLIGRGGREPEAWAARIALAERLGACVMTDLKISAMFPTDHPAHVVAPFNVLGKPAREILGAADVILALDWVDLGGALRQARTVGPVTARIASVSLDHTLHNGFNMDYQSLPTVDVAIAGGADELVSELVDALGPGSKPPWRERIAKKPATATDDAVTLEHVSSVLQASFNDPERVTFASLGRGWPIDLWPHRGAGAAHARPPHRRAARRRRLLHGRERDLDRGAPPHPAHDPDQQQPLLFQRRAAPGNGGEAARPQSEQPLDRSAHGRSRARHRQARRGAGRARHRSGAQREGCAGRDRARRRRAQAGRRRGDRSARRRRADRAHRGASADRVRLARA